MFELENFGMVFGTAKGNTICSTGRQKTHLRHSMQNTGIELFLSIMPVILQVVHAVAYFHLTVG